MNTTVVWINYTASDFFTKWHYSGDPNSEHGCYSNGGKYVECQMVWFLKGFDKKALIYKKTFLKNILFCPFSSGFRLL